MIRLVKMGSWWATDNEDFDEISNEEAENIKEFISQEECVVYASSLESAAYALEIDVDEIKVIGS